MIVLLCSALGQRLGQETQNSKFRTDICSLKCSINQFYSRWKHRPPAGRWGGEEVDKETRRILTTSTINVNRIQFTLVKIRLSNPVCWSGRSNISNSVVSLELNHKIKLQTHKERLQSIKSKSTLSLHLQINISHKLMIGKGDSGGRVKIGDKLGLGLTDKQYYM